MRTLYESCSLIPVLLTDKEKMITYISTEQENEFAVWKNHFSPNKLSKLLSDIESNLDIPDDVRDYLADVRKSDTSLFSSSTHSSYEACIKSTYSFSFDDGDESANFALFGAISVSTKYTLQCLNQLLYTFFGMLHKIFCLHEFKLKEADDEDWENAYSLLISYQESWKAVNIRKD